MRSEKEGATCAFAYSFLYNLMINTVVVRVTEAKNEFWIYIVMLVVFGLTPPLIVLSLTRLVRSKPATATHVAIPMLRHALLNSFVPKFWFMKPWQMCESVGFAVAVTMAPTESQKLLYGLGVSVVCTIPTLVAQQYDDNLEQNTDRIARVGTIITMTIGACTEQLPDGAAGATLVLVNLGVASWFAYAFGPKRLLDLVREQLAHEKATPHLITRDKEHIQDLTPDEAGDETGREEKEVEVIGA